MKSQTQNECIANHFIRVIPVIFIIYLLITIFLHLIKPFSFVYTLIAFIVGICLVLINLFYLIRLNKFIPFWLVILIIVFPGVITIIPYYPNITFNRELLLMLQFSSIAMTVLMGYMFFSRFKIVEYLTKKSRPS
jgi:membrane-bound ClpP family serine protease